MTAPDTRAVFLEELVKANINVLLLVAVPLSPGGLGVRQGAFSIMFFLIGAGAWLLDARPAPKTDDLSHGALPRIRQAARLF